MYHAPEPCTGTRCTSTLRRNDLSHGQSIVGLISRAAPCQGPMHHAPENAPAHVIIRPDVLLTRKKTSLGDSPIRQMESDMRLSDPQRIALYELAVVFVELGRMRRYTMPYKRWRKRILVVWSCLRTGNSSVSYPNETMLETSF